MGPLVKFTLLRLSLFVGAFLLLALAGARGWLLLILAAVVSLALSYVLLRGPREELAGVIAERASRRTSGRTVADEDADVEDAQVDRAARSGSGGAAGGDGDLNRDGELRGDGDEPRPPGTPRQP